MLSAQCDELRSMAASVGLEMPQAATLMMGAADAIDRLDAKNAKLREERDRYKAMYESVHVTAAELRRVRREWQRDREQNAKLRELVRAAWKCAHAGPSCYDCRLVAGGCTLQSAMRELGVDA